jgi:hypothetical protein
MSGTLDPNDPALSEPMDNWFARNDALPLPSTGARKESPAASLKRRCKEALKPLADLGSRPLWEPRLTAGKVKFANDKREFGIGNKGQADVIVTWFGHAWHAEIKAGRDRESKSQERYAPFITRSHGTRLIVRQPSDLVESMMGWYRTHPGTVAEALRDGGV